MVRGTNDPYHHLALLKDRINRLFEAAVTRADFDSDEGEPSQWSPLVDLYETEDRVVLVAEVPGLSMEDLDVQVTDSTLTLRGERRPPANEEGDVVHHRLERAHGGFARTFTLSAAIDRDAVTAEYRQGLLQVVLPKQTKTRPRTIPVNKT
jgi:HSP20 family protein